MDSAKVIRDLMDEVNNAYQDVLDAVELFELDENEETMQKIKKRSIKRLKSKYGN